MSNNCCGRCNDSGHNGDYGGGNGGGGFPQQPTWFCGNGAGVQQQSFPPIPYKRWENWNYCHTHGGKVDNAYTSAMCGNRGPTHNPNASRANIMGGLTAGMPKTILLSACGRKPPPPVASSSSNSHSNAHQVHTTPPKVQMPHPHILEQSNLPVVPTARG
jgi:hypothetical protein